MSDVPVPPGNPAAIWTPPHRPMVVAVALITLATILAYANSFRVPFLFDDGAAIVDNPSIKDLSKLASVLTPTGVTIGGRPVVNLSLALNYAWTGNAVWSYHVVNLAVHVLAALTLFGVLRRTLQSAGRGGDALPLAALATLLWALHPLQTCAVTYISQRAEAMMALFYLLTLYGFIRSVAPGGSVRWMWLSILCCFAGMATKEIMVTAPALVLLYDRVFVSRSFREALGRRLWYYPALALSWVLLGYLMVSSHLTTRSVGFNVGVSPLTYALTECKVVVLYLKLAFWPSPLVFDYGRELLVRDPLAVLPYVVLIFAGLAGTILLLVRGRKAEGFLAAAFFILLSPTSSFVPVGDQPMAENRMYLPLATIIILTVLGLHQAFGRKAWVALAVLAVQLCALSLSRNYDYRSPVAIWGDSLTKHPENSRGQYNFANELSNFPERIYERVAHYEAALSIRPNYFEAHTNLANTFANMPGRLPDAIAHIIAVIRLQPGRAEAHNNLGNYLVRTPGQVLQGLAHYEQAIRLKPNYAEAHFNLANELAKVPDLVPEAITHYELALRSKPDNAAAHYQLAGALAKFPARLPEALVHYAQTIRLQPANALVRFDYAVALARVPGRQSEAIAQYEAALLLQPNFAAAHQNLADELTKLPGRAAEASAHYQAAHQANVTQTGAHLALATELATKPGQLPEAIRHYEETLRLQPNQPVVHFNLANKLVQLPSRWPDAIKHYEEAIRLDPSLAAAHNNLAILLAKTPDRTEAAITHYQEAVRLKPEFAEAHYNLALTLAKNAARAPEALTHFEATLRLRPDLAEAHFNYACLLAAQSGRTSDAIDHFEIALRLRSDYVAAHHGLALVLAAAGRKNEAIAHLELALKINPAYEEARSSLEKIKAPPGAPQ